MMQMMKKYPGIKTAKVDKVIVVPKEFENNLPALAVKLYGKAPYWDLLYFANDLRDPIDIPMGSTLKVLNLNEAKKAVQLGVMLK